MKQGRKRSWSISAFVLAASTALIGCGNFFVPPDNSGGGGGGGGGGTGTARVYVANATTMTVSGFTIGTNKLTAVPNSPVSLGFAPTSLVVSPKNSFLYIAGPSSINVYAINSDGSLTAAQNGVTVIVNAIDVSPDGQWLFGLDNFQNVLHEYQIDSSSGGLTPKNDIPYDALTGTISRQAVKVSPTGNYVFAALGNGGDRIFTLNTADGTTTFVPGGLKFDSPTTSDNALAIDSTGSFLYIARSGANGGVAVYTIGAGGALNSISGSPFAAGNGPFSVSLDKTGKYLYVGNRTDGNISAYTIGTGSALTPIAGSPFDSGDFVNTLAIDPGGTYLLAGANQGNPDLSMYTFDATTPGKLNVATTIATDTDPAGVVAIAATH
ncbi:MAG TPA: beta-propeller fold lactonase family protein [Edaphobacter sp.]